MQMTPEGLRALVSRLSADSEFSKWFQKEYRPIAGAWQY